MKKKSSIYRTLSSHTEDSTIEGERVLLTKWKRRSFPLFLLFFFAVILPFTGFAESGNENLLYNGDFEILDADGLPDGWYTDAYLMDPGYSVYSVGEGMDGSDSHSATVMNAAKNDARFAQTIRVSPDAMYCLTGYVRADSITDGHGANLSIEGVYAFSRKFYDTNGEWERIEYYGETGPDQHYITVFARVGGYSGESKGTASFDKLCLTEVEGLPAGVTADRWYTQNASSAYDEPDEEEETDAGVSGPAWPYLVLISLVYTLIAFFIIYRCRDGYTDSFGLRNPACDIPPMPGMRSCIPVLLLALLLRIILSYFIEGYSVDVGCFTSWGYTMAHHGPSQFYLQTSFCDYPPLYTYILGLNSAMADAVNAGEGLRRVLFRLVPSICDLAGCWILLKYPRNEYTQSRFYRILVLLMAFNPVTVLNSAAWGQMDSVLCLLLLCVAVLAIEGRWVGSIAMYVTAVLVKPQALMLGILGLLFMVIAVARERNALKKILIAAAAGVALIALYVLPFGINQQPGWLISRYIDTLSSYPYAAVNTANIYYLAGGNWNRITNTAHVFVPLFLASGCILHGILWYLKNRNKRKYAYVESILSLIFACWFVFCAASGSSWTYTGTGAMAYAFAVVLSLAVRKGDMRFLPYLGALLFILLYVFGIKMHERYLFPAFLLLALAWALHKDRRILFILLFFSCTVFINEGIVLDNSIRFGASYGHLNQDTFWLADILSVLNIAGAVYASVLGFRLLDGTAPGPMSQLHGILPVRTLDKEAASTEYNPDRKLHWSWHDTVVLGCITIVYTVLALTTLGSTKAPQTSWTSSSEEEQIIFDLQEEQSDISILYFSQVSRKDFSFASSPDGMNWSDEVWAQMDQGQCWKWKYVTRAYDGADGKRTYYNNPENIVRFRGRYIRLTSQQVGLDLCEVVFRNADGEIIPAVVTGRNGGSQESPLWSEPEKLTDEQNTMEGLPGFFGDKQEGDIQPSWWNSTYFDEIYHARTGYEFLKGTVPYETSHPPLGKVLISWCIALFGMTPFGWRFAGAFAGILMIPGIWLLAKQLTKKTWTAFVAAMLMALDCMHLTQTQIATIDSFPVLFIIFAFFFMLRFLQTDLLKCSVKETLIPLACSGLFMGLSIASKWIGIYAGIGLAVLYFGHFAMSFYRLDKGRKDDRHELLVKFIRICIWCIMFFVAIPLAVYLVSYIPYMAYNTRIKNLWDYLAAVWRAQESMLSYHSTPGLGMDHPFYSPWWEWPIIGKPMFYATEQYIDAGARLHHSIFAFGNPVIWWGALPALVYALLVFLHQRHYRYGITGPRWHLSDPDHDITYIFIFIALAAQYLPWVLVPRGTYIYHYFASIPFLILCTSLCFTPRRPERGKVLLIAGIVYMALAAIMFILLLPYATGMAVPAAWLDIGKSILHIWY